jgi:hypothetical protein
MTREELRYFSTAEGRALMVAVRTAQGDDLAILDQLRKQFPPEYCRAGLSLKKLRDRGASKFAHAGEMVFDREALEQASGDMIASYRSRRYEGIGLVGDICCGIGGDAIALARVGDVISIDRNPDRVRMTKWNVSVYGASDRHEAVAADAEAWLPGVDALFLDPGRRVGTRRVFRLGDYSPRVEIKRLLSVSGNVGIKVAPGIPYDELPADCETEFISESGSCKEAVLWFGELRTSALRRATILPAGVSLTYVPVEPAEVKRPGEFLYEPDRAVIRAHLIDQLAEDLRAWKLEAEVAYLSSDTAVETPFAKRHRILEVFPFGLKRLQAYLSAEGVGRLDIKKRRFPMTPEVLRTKLKLDGDAHASIVLTRVQNRPTVLVCEVNRPE